MMCTAIRPPANWSRVANVRAASVGATKPGRCATRKLEPVGVRGGVGGHLGAVRLRGARSRSAPGRSRRPRGRGRSAGRSRGPRAAPARAPDLGLVPGADHADEFDGHGLSPFCIGASGHARGPGRGAATRGGGDRPRCHRSSADSSSAGCNRAGRRRRTGSGPRTRRRRGRRAAAGRPRRRRSWRQRSNGRSCRTLGADAISSAVYGCRGAVNTSADRAVLDDPAPVQDHHPVGDPGQRAQVVRDDHDRQPERVAQLVEQPQHVVAGAGVQRADRLVADQQPRLGGQRPGDGHPLALTAGDLGRRAVRAPSASRPDLVQRGQHPRRGSRLRSRSPRIRSPSPTISATVRSGSSERSGSWKIELHLALAALGPPGAAAQRRDRPSVEHDPAPPRVGQPDHGAGQRGLARAGLADQADDLARPDLQAHVAEHLGGPPAAAQHHVDRLHLEQRRGGASAPWSYPRRSSRPPARPTRSRRPARSAPACRSPTSDRSDAPSRQAALRHRAAGGEPAAGDVRADLRAAGRG